MLSRTSRPVTAALRQLVRTGVTQSTPSPPPQTGTSVPSPTPLQNLPPLEAPPPQAPNNVERWSTMQAPRPAAASLPRFEQTDMSLQPRPLSAMQLVSEDPIRIVHGRKAVCDGGECQVIFLVYFTRA
jgi:NADH dehydrogenase (ubiquinone) Fe-S protein 6